MRKTFQRIFLWGILYIKRYRFKLQFIGERLGQEYMLIF